MQIMHCEFGTLFQVLRFRNYLIHLHTFVESCKTWLKNSSIGASDICFGLFAKKEDICFRYLFILPMVFRVYPFPTIHM